MHWIPLRAARALALQSLTRNPSRDQPAMRTILFGVSAIVFWYVVQFIVLARITNPFLAFGWLALIFSAAHALRLRGGRLRRALQRARSFLAFRADPSLQPRLVAAVDQALDESLTLEGVLTGTRGRAARLADSEGRRQVGATQIPVPGIAPKPRARVLERLELQSGRRDPYRFAIAQQTLSVGRYQVRHRSALPDVSMQPEAAVHGVDHPFSP
jgi:hypothetical protein